MHACHRFLKRPLELLGIHMEAKVEDVVFHPLREQRPHFLDDRRTGDDGRAVVATRLGYTAWSERIRFARVHGIRIVHWIG